MNEVSPTRSVIIERDLTHAPEKVWRALTQPHLIAEWLMSNDFSPANGHRFTFRRTPRPDVEIVIDCEVLAVEDNRKLIYSWAARGLESVVTWTLTPIGGGTRLRMEQSGFQPDQLAALKGATGAWHQFFTGLQQVLDSLT